MHLGLTLRAVLAACALHIGALAPTAAFADDADPVQVRNWLCQFFNAPISGRVAMLSSAPLPFESGSTLTQEERPVSNTRSGAVAHTHAIGRRYADWRVAYSYQTRPDGRVYGFHLNIEGDQPLLLPDEQSVLVFLRGFLAPSFDAELDEYVTGEPHPDPPDYDPEARLFEVKFDIRSQDLSISWLMDRDAQFGRRFCNR